MIDRDNNDKESDTTNDRHIMTVVNDAIKSLLRVHYPHLFHLPYNFFFILILIHILLLFHFSIWMHLFFSIEGLFLHSYEQSNFILVSFFN